MDMFTIISIDENILRNALKSQIKDFEDAVIEGWHLPSDARTRQLSVNSGSDNFVY